MPGTIRQIIASMLRSHEFSAADIARQLLITESQVVDHLTHLKQSLRKDLLKIPAQCAGCGFEFRKRGRIDAPGRCPICKEQRIDGPWFRVKS